MRNKGRQIASPKAAPTRVYTDGSCTPNPGTGGWAYLIVDEQANPTPTAGGAFDTTNNRMEMLACIEALKRFENGSYVSLCVDSEYVLKGMTQWIVNWKRSGRLSGGSRTVKNADLWQELDEENSRLNVNWIKVRAHAGETYNELVDQAAFAFAKSLKSD